MNKIKLNTIGEVFAKGGGDSGSGGGADYHYLQFVFSEAKYYIQYATECKAGGLNIIAMASAAMLEGEEAMSAITSAKFDFNAYSSYSSEGKVKVGSLVKDLIGSYFSEITEEEFYNINTEE